MEYIDLVGDAYSLVTNDRESLPDRIDIELVDEVATYLTTLALSKFMEENEALPDTEEGQEAGEQLLAQKIMQVVAAAYVLAKIDGVGDEELQPTNPLTNRVVQELLAKGEVHLSIQVD
jgi:hypothetical protein